MSKYLLFSFFIFTFFGCSLIPTPQKEEFSLNRKVFEDENRYILFALRAEELKDYKSAYILFNTLYEKTDNKEYLYRSLKNRVAFADYNGTINQIDSFNTHNNDEYMMRLKVISLMSIKKYLEAENLAKKLVELVASVQNHILLSEVYIQEFKYEIASQYLEKVYKKEYNETILDKLSLLLYMNLSKKSEAITQLENHLQVHGSSELIARRLIWMYANMNNLDGLVGAYLQLFKIDKSAEISQKIIQIYSYQKEYIKLMDFLENSKSDDKILLQLYSNMRDYNKAYALAQELYSQTGEVHYLGQSAIYEYESSQNKNNKEMLHDIVQKLEDVVSQTPASLYLNYLGYVLIDHEIDIQKGIAYVKDALKFEPNSAYYLDSLAWGYYKLGKCKEAKELIDKVVELENSKNDEVILHLNSIDKCLKN